VWKDAIELAVRIYSLTEDEAFKGKASLRDQLERAAVSVSNNIADLRSQISNRLLKASLANCEPGPTAFKIPTSKASATLTKTRGKSTKVRRRAKRLKPSSVRCVKS